MITINITTPQYPVLTCLVILTFAAIHLLGSRIEVAQTAPRRIWLSAAGGISIAYVFVHILPELAHHQKVFDKGGPFGLLDGSERHVYFMALLGLVCFYGLELAVRASENRQEIKSGVRRVSPAIFWLQLATYALYNLIIGYLLLDREETGLVNLATYAVAMGLHFVVNDQGLRAQSYPDSDKVGRWVLAFAAVAGWTIAIIVDLPSVAIAGLFAFLAGGIILNVLKYELPADRQSDFRAFLLGAGAYAAILLVAH